MFENIHPPPQKNIKLRFKSISKKFQKKIDSVGFIYIFKIEYEMSTKSTKDKYEIKTKYRSTL